MKIKHQLAIFNGLSRLLLILVLWLMLPVLVEKVVYNHINKSLLEKKQKFIEHLDKEEINDFIVRNDTSETYASFSTLHSEFLFLSRVPSNNKVDETFFITEPRIIQEERNDYRILQYYFKYENTNYLLEIGNSLSEINDLTFIIRFFIIIVLIIIVVITFLADTFFIEYLLTPFYKIIDTKIRHVNEPEAFDHTPIQTHSKDFQELDTVLNQMMDRISELFKKEKQFIANVSHELLTPIALLKNKFENLIQNESLNDMAVDKIVSSLITLDLLKKIIANLLLISKIENNQYEANQSIDFDAIISDLVIDLQDRIEDKELSFHNNLEYHFSFTGNKTLLHILFYNLIVNAIKYNKPFGTIEITDGFLNGIYFLSISDSGIGMNEKQQQNVLKRFVRVSSDQEGQGLGLAIVESIAQFHHITIKIVSEINVGTTFLLLFSNERKPN
jgi:signal transduction histidine kinase